MPALGQITMEAEGGVTAMAEIDFPGVADKELAEVVQSPIEAVAIDYSKATKADDAAVPVEIWDVKVWKLGYHNQEKVADFCVKWLAKRKAQGWALEQRSPLDVMREWIAARWKRLVTTSFFRYLKKDFGEDWLSSQDAAEDLAAGRDCLTRAAASTFWAWEYGSRPFYWRWPESVRQGLRDGFRVWLQGELPANRRPQRGDKDPDLRRQVREKMQVARDRHYIAPGEVISLTNYFPVKKGDCDIRMVYDATKSGLNRALWTPSFALPTVESLTRQLEETTWMADLDLGDSF
jgi:hypothetical protein